jgi:LPXTG-motif cell wall-anchored protein
MDNMLKTELVTISITDGDGIPDMGLDTDGDSKADLNIDADKDGKADTNIDTDGDGKADLNVDTDGDGKPDLNIDTDGDGKPDLNIGTDGDGIADKNVSGTKASSGSEKAGSAATGDTTPVWFWMGLALASILAVFAMLLARRKRLER